MPGSSTQAVSAEEGPVAALILKKGLLRLIGRPKQFCAHVVEGSVEV